MINIFNIIGQKVYSNKIKTSVTSINLNNEAKGIYFIKIFNNEINKVEKIIIR